MFAGLGGNVGFSSPMLCVWLLLSGRDCNAEYWFDVVMLLGKIWNSWGVHSKNNTIGHCCVSPVRMWCHLFVHLSQQSHSSRCVAWWCSCTTADTTWEVRGGG